MSENKNRIAQLHPSYKDGFKDGIAEGKRLERRALKSWLTLQRRKNFHDWTNLNKWIEARGKQKAGT